MRDPDLERNLKIIDDLQKILNQVDAELHETETEVHQMKSELELERKKWEFNVRDVTKESGQMEDHIMHFKKQIVVSKQMNEEEIENLKK